MGRGVSFPVNCVAVSAVWLNDVGVDDSFDFSEWCVDIKETAMSKWKSLTECDKWVGREDHAILENDFCYIGVSEYCGVAAIWLQSKAPELESQYYSDSASKVNLARNWCNQIETSFYNTFGHSTPWHFSRDAVI